MRVRGKNRIKYLKQLFFVRWRFFILFGNFASSQKDNSEHKYKQAMSARALQKNLVEVLRFYVKEYSCYDVAVVVVIFLYQNQASLM